MAIKSSAIPVTSVAHSATTGQTATDHHLATIVAHSDTSATGPELDTLTDASETALHSHSQVVKQVVSVETGALITTTTQMPHDDTIPQNTEGVEVMTVAITPGHNDNRLLIMVTIAALGHSFSGTDRLVVALFKDAVAGALAAASEENVTDSESNISFNHIVAAGQTTEIVFKVRAGGGQAGTLTVNGSNSNRYLGGVMSSSIVIVEVAP